MAKKIEVETDEQYAAFALTKMIAVVNPEIDEEATYHVLCEALEKGLNIENAPDFGKRILMSKPMTSKSQH